MPRDLGELGVMYSREEVRELRQGDQAKIQRLKARCWMLEEKISRLSSLQSDQMPTGNGTFLFIDQLGSRLLWQYKGFCSGFPEMLAVFNCFRCFEGKFWLLTWDFPRFLHLACCSHSVFPMQVPVSVSSVATPRQSPPDRMEAPLQELQELQELVVTSLPVPR